ncbi:UPF0319 protein [Vibrio alfacsensis]|uniref:DUF2057 family protein n=1 Tax=Vibrio alfacsensis TaxID=1074311 RepID=UPI001BEF082F|nr:DUF2057 family protein [Vibrio alfacsensis]BBM64257.1 UPF0319 protein [Vibrio alfacsensis]
MKLKIWMSALVVLLTSGAVNANTGDVTPTIQSNKVVEVLFVNGQDADDLQKPFALKQGSNQLVVKTNLSIGHGDKRTQFKSVPYIITTNVMGNELEIDVPRFRDVRQAQQMFESEKADWKVRVDGEEVEFAQYKMPGKKGMFPYSDLDLQLAEYNRAQGVYFVNGKEVQLTKEEMVNTPTQTQVATKTHSSMTKAKIAYLEMSESEREAFLNWVSQQ